jgi:hypothetical protein
MKRCYFMSVVKHILHRLLFNDIYTALKSSISFVNLYGEFVTLTPQRIKRMQTKLIQFPFKVFQFHHLNDSLVLMLNASNKENKLYMFRIEWVVLLLLLLLLPLHKSRSTYYYYYEFLSISFICMGILKIHYK